MLTLWYIILGWKEYNKPFRKAEQPPPKAADPGPKKPDLIPQRKDVTPTPPQEIKKPEPPKSIPIDPKPPAEPSLFNNKTPKTPEVPEIPKMPELPKVPPKTIDMPKMPEVPKVAPQTPEVPKIPPRTPEPAKPADFRLAPEPPKKPEPPKTPEPAKTPEPPKFSPRTPEPAKTPEPHKFSPKTPEPLPSTFPSRRPESVMPDFPTSGRNPAYVPPGNQSEFPFLPGTPQAKPASKDDELFSVGKSFGNDSNKHLDNLRDLSYAKGEFPGEEVVTKVQETLSKVPKYMEETTMYSSDESDEDF